MINRFNKLIFLILVVALALYVVLLNQDVITVWLAPGSSLSANAGVILIASFVIGMLFTAIVALWFGMKAYFRERGMLSKEKQRQAFYSSMLKARSYLAAEDWFKAREQWEQIINKDPTDIIARVELSKSIQGLAQSGQAELLDALKILDVARTADPKNTEVLFRAAELNLALNNKTAALDNLALILYNHPNRRAARMARDLSEDLERFADAFEYQKQLEGLDFDSDHSEVIKRIRFKQLIKDNASDKNKLKDEVKAFLKRNSEFAPALNKLAELEEESGKLEEAATLYTRAARASGQNSPWHSAARIWIKNHTPEKAIASARAITNETRGLARINAELELIRLYIALSMLEDARKLCEGFPFLVKREDIQLNRETNITYLSLKGLCLSRMGEYKAASEIFKKLCQEDFDMEELLSEKVSLSKDAPAPRLSTP